MNNIFTNQNNAANAAAQREANMLNWRLTEIMANKQREWALSDFDRVNAYNSPLQQMQRLREAGLNPNLVYGNGAQNTAQMIRNVSQNAPKMEAAHFMPMQAPNVGGMLSEVLLYVERLRGELSYAANDCMASR